MDEVECAELVDLAAHLLGRELEVVRPLGRFVLRCREVGSDSTFVAKRARPRPWDRTAPEAATFLTEIAALQFLGTQGPGLVAADPDAGVLVMGDLGAVRGLHSVLLEGTAEEARTGWLQWAGALGTLHAATAGRRAEYKQIREALGPTPQSRLLSRVEPLLEVLGSLGLSAPAEELRAAVAPEDPELDTWLHRDPCPDNVALGVDGAQLFDFEHGAFGAASSDAAFLRVGVPTCWCAGVAPDSVVVAAEARYREAAAAGLPALADDARFEAMIADGAAHHLMMTLVWLLPPALVEDQIWGAATHRDRVCTRLARFATAGRWPGLEGLAQALLPLLRERWGDVGLRLFPAFRR